MKKVSKNKSILIAMVTAALFTVATLPAAAANDSAHAIPVELKFLGEVKNQLQFQLNLEGNAEENEFVVTITDDSGASFYKGTFKGEKIIKKFLFSVDEFGDTKLKFHVTSKKTNQTVTYEVNQVVRTVQDVVVNKL
jgi:hypothetical protein